MNKRAPTDFTFHLLRSPMDDEQFVSVAEERDTGKVYFRASNIASALGFHLNKVSALDKGKDVVMLKGVYYATLESVKDWLFSSIVHTKAEPVFKFISYLEDYERELKLQGQQELPLRENSDG